MKTKRIKPIEMEILHETELSKIIGGKTIIIYIGGRKYEIEV